VTAADREVETLIRTRVAERFAGDTVLGEEGGGDVSDNVWVVDPIDGTTNFMRGLPEFGVSIAFVSGGRTELGVIYAPALDALYAARRGGGATKNEQAIHVRSDATFDTAVVTVGFDIKEGTAGFLERLSAILEGGAAFRRFGSASIGLASVAAGHVDAFWQMGLSAWDVLAGLLLVEEAGGAVCDFARDGLLGRKPTLAAAPGIADRLSAITGVPLCERSC
jgi:myo-inositol-1(or 4)-monophosphatase